MTIYKPKTSWWPPWSLWSQVQFESNHLVQEYLSVCHCYTLLCCQICNRRWRRYQFIWPFITIITQLPINFLFQIMGWSSKSFSDLKFSIWISRWPLHSLPAIKVLKKIKSKLRYFKAAETKTLKGENQPRWRSTTFSFGWNSNHHNIPPLSRMECASNIQHHSQWQDYPWEKVQF